MAQGVHMPKSLTQQESIALNQEKDANSTRSKEYHRYVTTPVYPKPKSK